MKNIKWHHEKYIRLIDETIIIVDSTTLPLQSASNKNELH